MLSDLCSCSNRCVCVVDYLINLVLGMIHVDDGQLRFVYQFTISTFAHFPGYLSGSKLRVCGFRETPGRN